MRCLRLRFVACFLTMTLRTGFGRGDAVVSMKEYMQHVCTSAHPRYD